MERLVESIPNFSEGIVNATLEALSTVLRSSPGVWLLDRTADADHNRSVYTMAGDLKPTMDALRAAVAVAIERIDMRQQRGQHPRIGAVDVVPFVPLGSTSMAECVDAAQRFGAAIADDLGLPVYLYAEAAVRPDRHGLASLRRAGFEGLAEAMRDPEGRPDLGPDAPHPTAGAIAVGARRPLIAFNIQLSTLDVAVARRIAGRIRERDGGLPAVQALGIDLASQGCTQLSMNLLDHARTPLWVVWERADELARGEGVSLLDSELIGLAPARALTDVSDHLDIPASGPLVERVTAAARWLRIRRFEPDMALEIRLASMRRQ
jgi:glutamate formiminotransferase / 5-formyltetrahydrofolate cyclo-ligase